MPSQPRVLVADDDRDLLHAVGVALARLGIDVVRVETGGDLIEKMAEEGPFDLLVTDVAMPWMNGLQAIGAVRTAGLGLPVVVITALDDEKLPAKVAAFGERTILLRKPFELAKLESTVARLLSEPRS